MYCDKVFSKPIYTKHTEIERNKEINYCNFKDLKKISSNYLDDQTFWTNVVTCNGHDGSRKAQN